MGDKNNNNNIRFIIITGILLFSAPTILKAQKEVGIDSLLNVINIELRQDSIEKIFLYEYFGECYCQDIDSTLLVRKKQPDYERIHDLLLNTVLPNAKIVDRKKLIKTYNLFLYWYKKEFSDFIQLYNNVGKYDRAAKIKRDSLGTRISCETKIDNLREIIFRFENILFAERFKNKSGLEIYSCYMESNAAILDLMRGDPFLPDYEKLYPAHSLYYKMNGGKITGGILEIPYANEIKPFLYQELLNFSWDSLNTTEEYKKLSFVIPNNFGNFFQKNLEPKLELYFEKNIQNWVSNYGALFMFKVLPRFENKEFVRKLTYELIYDKSMNKNYPSPTYHPDYNKEHIEKLIKRGDYTNAIRDVILEESKKYLSDEDNPALKYIRYFNEKEVTKFLIDSLGLNTTAPPNKVKIANTLMHFYEQLIDTKTNKENE